MTDHTVPRTLTWAWEQQRIWSLTANRPKQHLDRACTTALVLTLVAAVLAVAGLSTVVPFQGLSPLAAWAPVATTAATTVAAHIAAARYDHLVIEYLRTAQQLEHLRDTYRDAPGDPAAFVDACENVISVENQGWMTRWTTDSLPPLPKKLDPSRQASPERLRTPRFQMGPGSYGQQVNDTRITSSS